MSEDIRCPADLLVTFEVNQEVFLFTKWIFHPPCPQSVDVFEV